MVSQFSLVKVSSVAFSLVAEGMKGVNVRRKDMASMRLTNDIIVWIGWRGLEHRVVYLEG